MNRLHFSPRLCRDLSPWNTDTPVLEHPNYDIYSNYLCWENRYSLLASERRERLPWEVIKAHQTEASLSVDNVKILKFRMSCCYSCDGLKLHISSDLE